MGFLNVTSSVLAKPMTLISNAEKKEIKRTFLALRDAIDRDDWVPMTTAFKAFRRAHRGASRAYMERFLGVDDREFWAGQMRLRLTDNLDIH